MPALRQGSERMASSYETFWENRSFAVVGHTAKKNFPLLTYRGLKGLGLCAKGCPSELATRRYQEICTNLSP